MKNLKVDRDLYIVRFAIIPRLDMRKENTLRTPIIKIYVKNGKRKITKNGNFSPNTRLAATVKIRRMIVVTMKKLQDLEVYHVLILSGLLAKASERWILDAWASTHTANSLEKLDAYREIDNLPMIVKYHVR
ncbi:hypothetical protein EV44_g3258 [Erysiphe necator]|uniref:Uncharacterized protein n=1 Tax=Uncinula necator TaxID=52586 RepID=A0A0B1P8Q6_UNCNE|nr:hypothetical protein EV44_g3258 [Erysiphe necator]